MKTRNLAFITAAGLLTVVLSASAQGTAFQYEGRLAEGTNPVNGTYDLRFTVYDSTNNPGTIIAGPVTTAGVSLANGLFAVTLDFGPGIFTGAGRWMEIGVRTNGGAGFAALSPRQPVSPSPYAIYAAGANAAGINGTLPATSLSGLYGNAVTFNNMANQFTGTGSGLTGLNASQLASGTVPAAVLGNAWKTMGNSGTTAGINFLGTTDNQALELRVYGQRALRLEPTTNSPNVIGGFSGNYVDPNAVGVTIAGGGANGETNCTPQYDSTPPSDYSSIGGGSGNTIISGKHGTIGGGYSNMLDAAGLGSPENSTIGGGYSNLVESAMAATIAGGAQNIIRNDFDCRWATIGGGESNRIDSSPGASIGGGIGNYMYRGYYGTIGGGLTNQIGQLVSYATVGGGAGNVVRSFGSTISGGIKNLVSGFSEGGQSYYCAIGGGYSNSIGNHFTAATIAGGFANQIVFSGSNDCSYGAVGGGQSNSVYGLYSVVPGGFNNLATNYAFAAGYRAKAVNEGAFVWAAGNTNDYPSKVDNRVHIYAAGGMKVENGGQSNDGSGLRWIVLASTVSGRMINVHNGAYLSEGGSWVDSSDRNAKENFEALNTREILERVATLPIARWNYRAEDKAVRHLGPVAQDFATAFGLGADDKHIAPLDSSGVALAAVQGLNDVVKEKDAEIRELRRSVAELKSRVDSLLEKSNGGKQ